jgi:NTP-dependent ternary conflict system VMAP-like protein
VTQLTPASLPRTIVVVDVVGFTNPDRRLGDRLAVRQGMYDVLKTAFAESDVDFDSCVSEDRGDGALILLPLGTANGVVVDRLPDRIVAALRRYNSTRTLQAQFKLRVGLNSGEVMYDGNGWVGHAVDSTFRILEAPEAKSALAQTDRMVAFICSDRFFLDVIDDDPGLVPGSYRQIPVSVKQFSGIAYLRMLGDGMAPATQNAPDRTVPPAEVPEPVLAVIPETSLDRLRGKLTLLTVPRLAVVMSRSLGPAIPLPPLDEVTDAWSAYEVLSDYNAGPSGIPPAVMFLRLLAEEFSGDVGATITDVLSDQTRRLRLGPALERQQLSHVPIPDRPHLHLTILLEPDSIDPRRFTLASWRQDDPEVWPPALDRVREVTFDELEYRVDEVILQAEEMWAGQSVSAAVEFLLPRALLNLPVQRWRKEHASARPQPLRYDYRLSVRSLERTRFKYWHRPWNARWESMLEDPSAGRMHYSGCAEFAGHPIEAVLSGDQWIGLVMTGPPDPCPEPGDAPDELTAALRSGLPVIFWHPDAGPEDLRGLVDWILGGDSGFIDLPARRKLANTPRSSPFDDSLVRDLVIMWDDPKRVIVLDQPLIPARQ